MNANRPRGFIVATVAVVLQAVIPYFDGSPVFLPHWPLAIPLTILYIFFFWRGRALARGVVLVVCVFNFVVLYIDLSNGNPWGMTLDLIALPLSVFLLYWLNTRTVKAHFSRYERVKRGENSNS
jgi:hypothetical protein